MPRLRAEDCEIILRELENRPTLDPTAERAITRLRQRLSQAISPKAGGDPAPTVSLSRDGRRACTLHVCTSCRSPGSAREPLENRPGFRLYEKLRETFNEAELPIQVDVVPAECLSLCPRPCGIAISSAGAWTYLFGDQNPEHDTADVLDCVSRYAEAADGFMARDERPQTLRKSILGRVPPLHLMPEDDVP